jgi:hypothetical protein
MSFKAFRKAQKRSNERPRGGGGRVPWQSYIFNMALDEEAGIRIVAPPNDDFFDLKSHSWPKQICTAELPGFDGKCVYCYYNERDKDFQDKNYASTRTVACLVDFRYFHWDSSGDKTQVYPCADPEPTPTRVTCRYCKSNNADTAERRFGGQKRWELTDDQRQQLMGVHSKLELVCVGQTNPKDADSICESKIRILGYKCGNSKCAIEIIDEDVMQTHDVSEALGAPFECEECGETEWLEPIMICKNGGSNDSQDKDKTHNVEQGSLFSKIVEVSCSGQTKKVKGKDRTTKSYNFDRNVAPFSRLEDDLAAFGLSDEQIKECATHDDLLKRFAPFRLDPSEYKDEEEYVYAVLKKQVKSAFGTDSDSEVEKLMPEEYRIGGNGAGRSTGGLPWRRKRN